MTEVDMYKLAKSTLRKGNGDRLLLYLNGTIIEVGGEMWRHRVTNKELLEEQRVLKELGFTSFMIIDRGKILIGKETFDLLDDKQEP